MDGSAFPHLLARRGFPGCITRRTAWLTKAPREGSRGPWPPGVFAEVLISAAPRGLEPGWARRVLRGDVWLQPSCEPLEIMTLFFPPWVTNGSHVNAWRGEHSSFLCARGFPIVRNKMYLWYNSLFVGMLLCWESRFLALQIWNEIMSTCDCTWRVLFWFSLAQFYSHVFHKRRRWAVAKESAVWGERDVI